jgi:hypothetical protein
MFNIFQDLQGKINDFNEMTCEKIFCIQVLKDNKLAPGLFWIKFVENDFWYRFFIDAYILHWDQYEKLSEDDFNDPEDFPTFDVGKKYNLNGLKVKSIEVKQDESSQQSMANLTIEFSENKTFILNYSEEKVFLEVI